MNKLCKILTSLTLASTFVVSLAACNNNAKSLDDDFDGLTNDIDPNPRDNKYEISLIQVNDEGEEQTNNLTLTMDYRDFLKEDYQYNLGILGSFLVNSFSGKKPMVHNNVYPSKGTTESELNPLLAQIGAENIEIINISKNNFNVDPYDVVDLLMGHHSFAYLDKIYQVFFAVIIPYPTLKGWISNVDMGAADESGNLTESYKQLEGENHEDWTNHSEHKGFQVSATRALREIEKYQTAHKNKDATDTIMYVTGHSRGGAVSNLIGKEFVDKNKQVRAYCFNPARTTVVDDEDARKDSYNNCIFNIINKGDLVSHVPSFGFKLYGKDIEQDVDEEKYLSFTKHEYNGNSSDTIDEVEELLNKLLTKDDEASRNNFYEFWDKDEDYPEKWEGTKEEMTEFLNKLNNGSFIPNDSYSKKCFAYSDVLGEDPDCYIEYQARPALVKGLLIDILDKQDLTYLLSYLELLHRLLTEALVLYTLTDFTIQGVMDGHLESITCVLAWQLGQ